MSKPKIYISSTFFDLEEHRSYLIRTLGKTERFDVVSMENYGTRNKPPLVKCLEDVRAAEFYILLVGSRYGYVPETEQSSITHLEYKEAVGNLPDRPGALQAKTRCVLPFMADDNMAQPDKIKQFISQEQVKDGPAKTEWKNQKLQEWKQDLQHHFTLDERFTTPSDLTAKVLAALIPELIDRNYADVVRKLILNEDLVYRCDRKPVRNEFLRKNSLSNNFFKAFIVHGEKPEWPVYFSINMVRYELTGAETVRDLVFDDYTGSSPERFLDNFILDCHESIFKTQMDPGSISLEALVRKIHQSNLSNIVLIYDLEYKSWKEKYKRFLVYFFDMLAKANAGIESTQSVYILINLKYASTKEKLKNNHPSLIVLDRLNNVTLDHVQHWIRTYLFINTRREQAGLLSKRYRVAERITSVYFPDGVREFTMETVVDRLRKIVTDFNNNVNFFSDYTKLSDK